jgi:hypothetical protein
MVVTSVRDGFSGMPFHGGVDREESVKVIVVVATAETADVASAAVEVPVVNS